VLIGDAAAATDPSWGNGLSKTLVDVETLAKHLTATDDWSVVLAKYLGSGEQLMNNTFVENLVDVIFDVLEKPQAIHGMDQLYERQSALDLVPLEMTDEVPVYSLGKDFSRITRRKQKGTHGHCSRGRTFLLSRSRAPFTTPCEACMDVTSTAPTA
jgi:hypothetical protein